MTLKVCPFHLHERYVYSALLEFIQNNIHLASVKMNCLDFGGPRSGLG